MALPKAVRDQVSKAERIMKDLAAEQDAAAEAAEQSPVEQQTQPEQQEAPKQEPPKQEAPKQEPPKQDEDYAQKYKVLQGKYNAEVPRLQRQVNELTGQLERLEGLLSQVQQAPQETPQAAAARLVTDAEIEEYGPEFMDIVGRRAQEIAGKEISKLNDKVKQLESKLQNVGQTVDRTGKEKVYALLDKNIEDWEAINESPEWDKWLGERDILSGIQRGRLLHEAFRNNDAQRVLSFFQQYKREYAAVQPPPSPPREGDSSGGGAEKLVAPGRARSPSKTVGAQEEQRVYTQADIARFYEQKRKGVFKKNPDRAAAIEADILKAASEGRVVTNQPPFANAAY